VRPALSVLIFSLFSIPTFCVVSLPSPPFSVPQPLKEDRDRGNVGRALSSILARFPAYIYFFLFKFHRLYGFPLVTPCSSLSSAWRKGVLRCLRFYAVYFSLWLFSICPAH